MSNDLPVAAAPMTWWRPDTYPRLLDICADRKDLFPRFEEWRENAQKHFDELFAQGVPVVKVVIDPEELLAWAKAQGRDIDGKARAEFATVVYQRNNTRERHGPARG